MLLRHSIAYAIGGSVASGSGKIVGVAKKCVLITTQIEREREREEIRHFLLKIISNFFSFRYVQLSLFKALSSLKEKFIIPPFF